MNSSPPSCGPDRPSGKTRRSCTPQADIILYNTCAIRENAEILYTAQFPISDEGLEQLRTWLLEHAAAVNAANPESFRYAW